MVHHVEITNGIIARLENVKVDARSNFYIKFVSQSDGQSSIQSVCQPPSPNQQMILSCDYYNAHKEQRTNGL